MTQTIELEPCGPITGSIRPPGSKSITNRALVCAALAEGESLLSGALHSEDTEVMIASLQRLGIDVTHNQEEATIAVVGCRGVLPAASAELYVANSGTTVRFLTALACLGNGEFRLDGIERMRERPIGDLAAALRQLGVDIVCESPNECPPVMIKSAGLNGGTASVGGSISSQYLSGLLMAAPASTTDIILEVTGELVSKPYIAITTAVMKSFGVTVLEDDSQRFVIRPQTYQGCRYDIEPDASAASYFWAAAAIAGGEVTVEGLTHQALQGDVAFVNVLEKMGCEVEHQTDSITVRRHDSVLNGIDIDMNAISDTVQTLAAVAMHAQGSTTIRNVAHNRHKETDRIGDLAVELRKLGATVTETEDGMIIDPPAKIQPATLETYNDHRMAMSFALIGLTTPGIVITNPGCTAKTYPDYFADLKQLAGTSAETSKG